MVESNGYNTRPLCFIRSKADETLDYIWFKEIRFNDTSLQVETTFKVEGHPKLVGKLQDFILFVVN